MTIEATLVASLETASGMQAAFGGRMYPERFPDTARFPCLVYSLIGTTIEQSVDRTIASYRSRFQFDIWGETVTVVLSAYQTLVPAVNGVTGSQTPIYEVSLATAQRFAQPEAGLFRQILDVLVLHG